MGSPLKSKKDLHFRNLGGRASLFRELSPDLKTVSVKTRLTKAAEAGDMIIEHFDFEVWHREQQIYAGSTNFGFFTPETLAVQEGIRDADQHAYTPTRAETQCSQTHEFSDRSPLSPRDPERVATHGLALPARAIRMIDRIEAYIPDGGPRGLGFAPGAQVHRPATLAPSGRQPSVWAADGKTSQLGLSRPNLAKK